MYSRPITYKNLNNVEVTKTFYFHLFPDEIAILEASHNGGLSGFISRVSQTDDHEVLMKEFKAIICLCYGVRDGDDFLKSDDLTARFIGSGAFSSLFIEFLTKDGSAVEFMKNVVPQEIKDLPTELTPPTNPIPPPPLPAEAIAAGQRIVNDAGM